MIIINLIIFFYLRGETMFCLIKNKKVKKRQGDQFMDMGQKLLLFL